MLGMDTAARLANQLCAFPMPFRPADIFPFDRREVAAMDARDVKFAAIAFAESFFDP
jgi:hypothetical protein